MTLGTVLEKCMNDANLRDEDVAVRLGVAASTVNRWRSGSVKPRKVTVMALERHVPGFKAAMKNGKGHAD